MLSIIGVVVLSYIIGSIPTSIILGKLLKDIDIRDFGSGNAGGTNVLRTLGWGPGLVVIFIDVAKGWVAAYYIARLGYDNGFLSPMLIQITAGVFAILGHVYTVFAGFKGGKGVGTAAGMLLAIYPVALIFCFLVFLIVAFTSKFVSLASMLAAITLPISLYLLEIYAGRSTPPAQFYFALFVMLFILYTHRSNIQRLLKGEESRFGVKSENPGQNA